MCRVQWVGVTEVNGRDATVLQESGGSSWLGSGPSFVTPSSDVSSASLSSMHVSGEDNPALSPPA